MPTNSLPTSLLTSFASAGNTEDRQRLFQAEPLLHQPEAVEALCARAAHSARKDPNLASAIADAALWLAQAQDHAPSQGLAHRTLANVLSSLAKPSEALSEYAAALACFEALGADHQAAITRSSALPVVTDTLGADAALDWASKARRTFQGAEDKLRLARLENNLAILFFRQDDFTRALYHWKEAYSQLELIGETSDQAAALRNLAVCSISLNEPAEAKRYYRKARSLCETHNYTFLLHEIDYNIAYLHYLEGDHYRALSLYQASRKRSRELGDTYHEAYCSLDETEIYIELNLLQEAYTVAQLADTQFREQQRPYEAAKARFNLALVKARLGDPRAALDYLDSAALSFEGLGNILWPGQVEFLRAQILCSEGRLFEAGRSAEKARTLFGNSHLTRRVALSELLLAKVYRSQGRLGEAEALCRAALDTFEPLGEPDSLFQTLFLLGETLDAQGDSSGATGAFRRAESFLVELRNRRSLPQMRIPVVERPFAVYGCLIRELLADTEQPISPSEIFRLVETAKSRSLGDRLTPPDTHARSRTGMRSQLVDQVSLLRQELDWLYRRIDRSELQEAVTSPSLVSSLQAESQSKEIELARILSSHQSLHPGLATDPVRNGGANIELVQSQLGDSLLLEYFMASGLVIVGVFSQKRHEVLPIAVQSSVQDLQRRLWYYLHHERPPDEASPSRTDELPLQILRALYEELLQPIEGMLDGWPVIIAPHDVLFLVPFHALRGSEGHLVDRAPVSYVPSASALLKEATLDLARPGSVGVLGGSEPLDELQAFFLGGEEAQRVQLADNSASSESTRVATTLDVSAAHLIGQAKLRDDNPLFSEVTVGDTAVTLLDLCRTRPLSPLMTVEGTGFGASSPTAHTEVEGLWRALLTSGARSVLVPQGPTPPEVHRRHAELLYKELARGTTLAVAHREAMLSMRDADAGLHEWAAMFLVGDPLLTLWPQR